MARKRKSRCRICGKRTNGPACKGCVRKYLAGGRQVVKATAPTFLAKSAAPAPVFCLDCRAANRRGNACCTACGALLPGTPVPPLSDVNKSALADEH